MKEYNHTNTLIWTGQKEWEKWDIGDKCPNCDSDEIEYNTRLMLTSYPPKQQLRCKKCGHYFSSGYTADLIDNDELDKLYEHVKDIWGIPEVRDPLPGEAPYIGDWQPSYPEIYLPHENAPVGWICPKCGRCLAPHLDSCPYCSAPTTINITY